jgi:hypothetical protein
MANSWRALDDPAQAIIALLEGLVMDPGATSLIADLVPLYRRIDAGGCSVPAAGPPGINPGCPIVHGHLCTASRNVVMAYRSEARPENAREILDDAVSRLGCPAAMFQ